jgi:hypothetical protein
MYFLCTHSQKERVGDVPADRRRKEKAEDIEFRKQRLPHWREVKGAPRVMAEAQGCRGAACSGWSQSQSGGSRSVPHKRNNENS